MPTNSRRQTLVVEILCDERQGQRQAQDRLYRWLNTFGHTAPNHGFGFVSEGVLTGKRLSNAPSLSNNREASEEVLGRRVTGTENDGTEA